MLDKIPIRIPPMLEELEAATKQVGFTLSSDRLTGSFLRTLVAAKPYGVFLELGTGTGIATAWLLDGMDQTSRLVTVDRNSDTVSIAQRYLGNDPRVSFHLGDGADLLTSWQGRGALFDLIFADMPPGKFALLDETLDLLNVGGMYIVDDLVPQPNWESGHGERVTAFIAALERRRDLQLTALNWSSGLLLATRIDVASEL